MTERHQFFYFIVDRPESRNPEYLLKIGTSNNVKETRIEIEKNRENDLRTYAVYAHDDVRVLEKIAQDRLSARELKRGWYKIKKADLDALLEDIGAVDGAKYTTESKARVSSRSRKPATGGNVEADPTSDEEPPIPKPTRTPKATEQPRATKPAETVRSSRPDAETKSRSTDGDAKSRSADSHDGKPRTSEVDNGKSIRNTRPSPFPTQQPAAAVVPSEQRAGEPKLKQRAATPARKERASKPKKKSNEDGLDHSLDWD